MEAAEYLSPRDLGRAVGLSESSVRRWADDGRLRAERTAGGHRRIARAEAVRFVRESGLAVVRPDLLGYPRPELELRATEGVPSAEALAEAFQASDASGARRMIVSAFLDGAPLAEICDGSIRGALREVGLLWRDGPVGIVYEHRAIDICLHALSDIRSAIPDRADAPLALGGAVEGDTFLLPTTMTAVVLADVGFRVVNLGPHVPTTALLAAAEEFSPRLVWRASSIPGAGPGLRREVRELPASVDFVVGGRGLAASELPRTRRAQRLHSMAELAGFGRGLLARDPGLL